MIDLYPTFYFLAVIMADGFVAMTATILVLMFTVIGMTKFIKMLR